MKLISVKSLFLFGVLSSSFAIAQHQARAQSIVFTTDTTWKATAAAPSGAWNSDPNFNDSSWNNANIVYTQKFLNGVFTPGIWATPDLTGPPTVSWFRKTFDLNGAPTSGMLDFYADDDTEVYVNGVLVFNDKSGDATNQLLNFNVLPDLRAGSNVIAARVYDVAGNNHYGSARFVANVPEPGNIAMVTGMVFFGASLLLRRRRK